MPTKLRVFFGFMLVAAFGQAQEAAKFETASVTASAAERNPRTRGPYLRQGRFEMRAATIVDLISFAYKVDPDKVAGGPNWLEWDRFDVFAKVNGKPTAEALRPMLRGLLADRFKLAVQQDVKPMPAYLLTAGKKPTLKKSEASGESACPMMVQMGQPGPDGPPQPTIVFNCRGMTMSAFAEQVRMMPGQLNNMPVIDKTGIEGAFDLDLKFAMAMNGAGNNQTVFDALDKQLGLKLELGTAPLEVISVERVNRTPSPDPAGAKEWAKTTTPPTEFEVADIKPTGPDYKGMRFQFPAGGRVDFKGVTLGFMMQQAYDLISLNDIAGAPSWLSSDRYDIIGKAPSAANMTDFSRFANMNRGGPTVDDATSWAMIRALLKDRFKLEMHQEERPGTAYMLVAAKPKLKKADPDSRTKMTTQPLDAKEGVQRMIQYTFHNMTMAQFAARVAILGRYLQAPVIDATGLEGGYDLTITFSPAAMVAMGGRGGVTTFAFGAAPRAEARPTGGDSTLGASDPTGGLTLQEALEKQLGLKLEKQTRPVPVWVIDHIERKPTDN